jgi:hypothetical protein
MTTNEQIQKQNEAACVSVAIHEREIEETIQKLQTELEQEMRNSAKPGNPYQAGLQGRINGLKEALRISKAAL